MKKKAFIWTMLLTAMIIVTFSVATAPVKADEVWKPLFGGSPHYYGDPGPKDPDWYFEHRTRVGDVHVWNDGDSLYVTYYAYIWDCWVLTETHVAVAMFPTMDENGDGEINILDADIPQTKKGNPKVGRFPYKHEGLGGVASDPYTIPLGSWGSGTTLIIAAHAVVENPCLDIEETAWTDCGGDDAYFRGNNWATYFTYTVQPVD